MPPPPPPPLQDPFLAQQLLHIQDELARDAQAAGQHQPEEQEQEQQPGHDSDSEVTDAAGSPERDGDRTVGRLERGHMGEGGEGHAHGGGAAPSHHQPQAHLSQVSVQAGGSGVGPGGAAPAGTGSHGGGAAGGSPAAGRLPWVLQGAVAYQALMAASQQAAPGEVPAGWGRSAVRGVAAGAGAPGHAPHTPVLGGSPGNAAAGAGGRWGALYTWVQLQGDDGEHGGEGGDMYESGVAAGGGGSLPAHWQDAGPCHWYVSLHDVEHLAWHEHPTTC